MPILEKVATDYDGRFILVKINVDESPQLAQAFGVQNIPFVVELVDGQPVSQLPGVGDEAQIKQWLDSFLASPAVEAYNAGLQAEGAGDLETAESKLDTIEISKGDAIDFVVDRGPAGNFSCDQFVWAPTVQSADGKSWDAKQQFGGKITKPKRQLDAWEHFAQSLL